MSEAEFKLTPVEKEPFRRKRSKYDPIIDEFLKGDAALVEVSVEGRSAYYIRAQLNKRIQARDLGDKIRASVVNNILYLEKKK